MQNKIRLSFFWIILLFCNTYIFSGTSDTLFESLSPNKTNIRFKNTVVFSPQLNILQFPYYYNGGGVAVGDVNNDGLVDIYFTSNIKGGNKLYLKIGRAHV